MVEIEKSLNVWRDYEKMIQKNARRKRLVPRVLPRIGFWGGIVLFVLVSICLTGRWIFAHLGQPLPSKGARDVRASSVITRAELPGLFLSGSDRIFPLEQKYSIKHNGSLLQVETSIDPELQQYVRELVDRSSAYKTAVVVLRPDNGQILALANHADFERPTHENLCLRADFPAASLFKIVAAAAAIEARGFTPETTLGFRGQKYTLYKSQLREDEGKRRVKMSLKEAFGDSVNPFFGRVGIYHLGREIMAEYAEKFLFNHPIPFDLPVSMSSIEIPSDSFGLAEIASGYNRRTVISPLHAALLTAAVANKGVMMSPWLVSNIKDDRGNTVYEAAPSKLASPISEGTAQKMRILMEETVSDGTCKKAFKPSRRKDVLKDLVLGAKTGTINDQLGEHRCEWLSAFALPVNGDPGLAVAILTVHGEKLGSRPKDMAKRIFSHQFSPEG
jgi:cell division protein FtsI/penicillin-binding protein 2